MNTAYLSTSPIQRHLSQRHTTTMNGAKSSGGFPLHLKSLFQASLCSVAFIIATALAHPAAAAPAGDTASATAEAPAKAKVTEGSNPYSPRNRGLALRGYTGAVSGSFLVGGGISSPWISRCLRFNAAFGVAFYPDGLGSDPDAAWTPFGYGHARIEVGPPFLRTAPIRPYAFAGVALSVVGEAMSDDRFWVGGTGGIGLEVGFAGSNSSTGPVTYGFEFAGVGSGASVSTPDGDENLLSGFSTTAVIRSYFW